MFCCAAYSVYMSVCTIAGRKVFSHLDMALLCENVVRYTTDKTQQSLACLPRINLKFRIWICLASYFHGKSENCVSRPYADSVAVCCLYFIPYSGHMLFMNLAFWMECNAYACPIILVMSYYYIRWFVGYLSFLLTKISGLLVGL